MSAGVDVTIDTAKMAAVSQAVNNQMNIVKSCFESIKIQYLLLKNSHWEGASADVYFESMKNLCSEQSLSGGITTSYVVKALEEYVADFNSTVSQYETMEQKMESQHQALPTNVFDI